MDAGAMPHHPHARPGRRKQPPIRRGQPKVGHQFSSALYPPIHPLPGGRCQAFQYGKSTDPLHVAGRDPGASCGQGGATAAGQNGGAIAAEGRGKPMKGGALVKLAVVLVGLLFQPSMAASNDSSNYCGIYSLYTALKVLGKNPSLESLLLPQFISTPEGSTWDDLRRAAESRGSFTAMYTNMSVADLRRAKTPLILHVKNEYDSPSFNHFILCLPGSHSLALYDPPQEVTWSSGDDLAPV